MAKDRKCVLHPDRAARVDATGILVCDECFARYQRERQAEQGFRERPFYQSLVRVHHRLKGVEA